MYYTIKQVNHSRYQFAKDIVFQAIVYDGNYIAFIMESKNRTYAMRKIRKLFPNIQYRKD